MTALANFVHQLPDNATPTQVFSHWAIHHHPQIEQWFRAEHLETPPPFYASVDLRNSDYRLAPIDTNLFPAGFNNLSPLAQPLLIQAFSTIVTTTCPEAGRLLLIPENHTRNLYYLANLAFLAKALTAAGVEVRIGSLDPALSAPRVINWHDLPAAPAGGGIVQKDLPPIIIEPIVRDGELLMLAEQPQYNLPVFRACMVLLNNDLTSGSPEILQGVKQPILPTPELGWHKRKKSVHFRHYQNVVKSFTSAFGLDEYLLQGQFSVVDGVNFHEASTLKPLAEAAEELLSDLRQRYKDSHIPREPYIVIKANSGTYGMAVMAIKSADEILSINRKKRNKLAVGKDGTNNNQIILQEGIHSTEVIDGHAAEQTLYVVGQHVVGGFHRLHANKDDTGILNAPGMEFRDIPFTECCHMPCPNYGIDNICNRNFVSGVIARLATLAAAHEMAAL